MPISIRESEIKRLVRFYRNAVQEIARDFVGAFDFERGRLAAQGRQVLQLLDELDEKTTRWARRNIEQLYRAASSEAEKTFRRQFGFDKIDRQRARQFALVNEQAIQALLNDPEVGFLSGLRNGFQQIRDRMRTIQNQAKMFRAKQTLFDETIARVGILEGQSVGTIRDKIVNDLVSLKNNAQLKWLPEALKLPQDNIVRNVANLPFVKIPDRRSATGFRHLRVDHYAEMLARTKSGQAANLARRNRAMAHNVPLIQISKNKPLQDDACFLYIGKVFALTQAAKLEYKIPHVSELPNGGAPFHPNCTHTERQFVAEFKDPKELALAMVPPPAWALNRPWGAVQAEYRRRGGARAANRFNRAAQEMGRTTGGRERRRREEGLPPDKDLPVRTRVETVTLAPPKRQAPAPVRPKAGPAAVLDPRAAMSFDIPAQMASLQANEVWGKALQVSKVRHKLESVFDDLAKKIAQKLNIDKVNVVRTGHGVWGGTVNRGTMLEVAGTEAQAKELANAVGWTFGQEASHGFRVLRSGTKAARQAKSRGLLVKLKRKLSPKELQALSKQPGINNLVSISENELWFSIVDDTAPEIFQGRVVKAIEQATKREAKHVISKAQVKATKEFYSEGLKESVKKSRKLHEPIREARAKMTRIVSDAAEAGDLGFEYALGAELEFSANYKLADILDAPAVARHMLEVGNVKNLAAGDWAREVGSAVRKQLEKTVLKPTRRKLAALERETKKLAKKKNQIEKAILKRSSNKKAADKALSKNSEYKAIKKRMSDVWRETEDYRDTRAKLIGKETLQTLQQVREMGGVSFSDSIAKRSVRAAVDQLEEVAQYFPREWLEKSASAKPMRVTWTTAKNTGGYYEHFSTGNEARLALRRGAAVEKQRAFLTHELAHRMENILPELVEAEKAFFLKRTAGSPITPGEKLGFAKGTKIRKDKFGPADGSKHGRTWYMGTEYEFEGAYELLSMGMEGIYGLDREILEKLLIDRELYDFFLGILTTL